jgi:DNA polymerase
LGLSLSRPNGLQMNSWTHTAAKQLLENWQRCGVTKLPKPSLDGLERASKWLDQYSIQSGVQEAEALGLPGSSQRLSTEKSTTQNDVAPPIKAPVPEVGLVDREANPSPKPTILPKSGSKPSEVTLLGSPNESWQTTLMDADSRQRHFKVLDQDVVACRKCADIVCRRQKTVFGVGPVTAKLVMFGEAPGADEDRAGEPFVGAAGQLMNKILIASGLKREDVYIMNSLKCRPPNNRTPTDGEIENCRPYFEAQLETIQPEYIICWGSVAVRAVLKSTESVGRLRGRFHSYRGAKVLVTYHPAYLLRNPDAKRLTWEDMKMLMRELGIPVTTPKRDS